MDTFFWKEWAEDEDFVAGQQDVDLDTFEEIMGTASIVMRWRLANADAVGTERDVVRLLRREIERLLREVGVEEGKERLKGAVRGVVLMVKRKEK